MTITSEPSAGTITLPWTRRLIGPALLVVALAAVGLGASSSFFFADDFVNFQVAHDLGLSPALLNNQLFGHWIPGRRLLDWIVQRHRPVSWPLVLGAIIIMVGIAAIVLRRLVWDLVHNTVVAWAAAIALPLTAGITGTVQWYSGAAEPIPAMPLTLGAMLLQLWFIRRGRLATLIGSLALLFASLAFDERAVALVASFPVLLLLVEVPRRWKRVVVLEIAAVLALAIYVVAQRYFTQQTPPTQRPSVAVLAEFIVRGLFQNALPSLIGLPTRALLTPVELTVFGVVLLAAFTVSLMVIHRRRAVFSVIWFLALATALFAATGWVRAAEFGTDSALEPRYAAALMPVGLIAAAIVVASLIERRPRWRRPIAIGLPVVVAIAAASGVLSVAISPAGGAARTWWSRVEADASAHPNTAYYDIETPAAVVPPAFFPASLLSNVASVLDPTLDVAPTTRTALALTATGRAVPSFVRTSGSVRLLSTSGLTPAGQDCWRISRSAGSLLYAVDPVRTAERTYVRAQLDSSEPAALTIAGAATPADTLHGYGGSASVGARQGTSWITGGISRRKIGAVQLTITGAGTICITDVGAGELSPTG